MIDIKTYGSICSGIEAASFVLQPLGLKSLWLSEIDDFTSRFLRIRYPQVPNLGDMEDIPSKISADAIDAPDLLCGGTPCQAFSLAGWKRGLSDERGRLTLKYIDILDAIDAKRAGKDGCVFFWENVEGVLTNKTNAFGCFLAGLAGYDEPLPASKWPNAGILHGVTRNIAWRVLDAKYFGTPQQRRRVYVLGGDKNFYPENILFELGERPLSDPYKTKCLAEPNLFPDSNSGRGIPPTETTRTIGNQSIEIFRTYTDCLYAAYGTKWNGNAAAFNGSLYVTQNDRLRRLTPIECERLMGFPDDYTLIDKCTLTNRYRATGNSWPVNVVRWIMRRLLSKDSSASIIGEFEGYRPLSPFIPCGGNFVNASQYPYDFQLTNFIDFIDLEPNEKLYISPTGCSGILRRRTERKARMNPRLEKVLKDISGVDR